MARIPGKMRRIRVRTGDLLIIKPWEIQNEKSDVVYRYRRTQSMILSRKKYLPDIIDVFWFLKKYLLWFHFKTKLQKLKEKRKIRILLSPWKITLNYSLNFPCFMIIAEMMRISKFLVFLRSNLVLYLS